RLVPRAPLRLRVAWPAHRVPCSRRLRTRRRRPARAAGHSLRMKLSLVGISHRHAPIEVRERVALDARRSATLARELARDGRECVCLSTCNRTELYAVGDDVERRSLDAL